MYSEEYKGKFTEKRHTMKMAKVEVKNPIVRVEGFRCVRHCLTPLNDFPSMPSLQPDKGKVVEGLNLPTTKRIPLHSMQSRLFK